MSRVLEILRLVECGATISEISRTLKIDRKTARSYVTRADALTLSYRQASELTEEELRELFQISRPGPRPPATLDFAYLHRELKKPGVTRQLLYEEYLRAHPGGLSYSRFCTNLRVWEQRQQIHYRRDYKAGERMEVDYAGQTVPIYDERTGEELYRAQIFVATLCASNLTYVEASRDQSLPCWIGSHCRALSYIGGVPASIAPDNLKSGVTSACNYDPEINKSYADFAAHYGVAIFPTRSRKPRDKAKVEAAVGLVERQVLAPLRAQRFTSLDALNAAIEPLLEALQHRTMRGYGCSRRELFQELESEHLAPLPLHPFVLGLWKKAKVHVDYHVQLENAYYSVPHQYAHETVEIRYSDMTVEVFCRNQRIAAHPRTYKKNRYQTLKEHMPASHRHYAEWNPQRFLDWAETIGEETKIQVNSVLLEYVVPEQAYRKCLGLLSCARKFGAPRLELACKKANALGLVSPRRIRNMLNAHLEAHSTTVTEETETPQQHRNIRGDTAFH